MFWGCETVSRVLVLSPRRFEDERGWFSEVYSERVFDGLAPGYRFVQDNHSLSRPAFTLRGLHFQRPPHAQAKLVRCVRGSIFDVAVDIRAGSPTYGRWVGATLDAASGRQLFVPVGFAHGFLTLEPDCEVVYKVTDFYSPADDGGLVWSDPDIGIDWPLPAGAEPALSPKDAVLPRLAAFESPFPYDGTPLTPLEGA